jgi:hypothetical protein
MILNQFRQFLNKRKIPFYEDFSYRLDDVVIVSYPKSGSTWLRFILAHLIDPRMPSEVNDIDFLRTHMIVPEISEESQQKGVDFNILPSPRFMRSHSLYTPRFPKVVYLVRDGRDVLISYYHHFRKFNNYDGTLLEFITSDLRDIEWSDHVRSWMFRDPPVKNLLLVRYEDMLSNPVREVKRVTNFGNLSVSETQLQDAVLNSSFQAMQEKEENKGLGIAKPNKPEIKFVRKGIEGEWKNVFSSREKEIANQRYGEILDLMKYNE